MKSYSTYMRFIADIRAGKTHIIFGPDYVVLSRKAFDELAGRTESEIKLVGYDEYDSWLRKRFLEP